MRERERGCVKERERDVCARMCECAKLPDPGPPPTHTHRLQVDADASWDGYSAEQVFASPGSRGYTFDDIIVLPGSIDFGVDDVDLTVRGWRDGGRVGLGWEGLGGGVRGQGR